MNQQSLFYSDPYDALRAAVDAAGRKKVAGALWPDMEVDKAAQKLGDALNPKRREVLQLHDVLTILRMAQAVGFHDAMWAMCDEAEYQRPDPINQEQRLAELQKDFMRAVDTLERIQTEMKATGDSIERKGPVRAERAQAQPVRSKA